MSKISHDAISYWGTGQSTNADSSAGYAALPSQQCSAVTISNIGATDIDVRLVGSTDSPFEIPAGSVVTIPLNSNLSEVEWKRTDDTGTYTISYLYNL